MPLLLCLLLLGAASRIVLFLLMLWTQLSLPGSAARRWTKFASGVVISSIPFAIDSSFFGYPILKAVFLGMVTSYILASFYELIFH